MSKVETKPSNGKSNGKSKDLLATAEAFQNDFIADQQRVAGENFEALKQYSLIQAQINVLQAEIDEIDALELKELEDQMNVEVEK